MDEADDMYLSKKSLVMNSSNAMIIAFLATANAMLISIHTSYNA